jgi:hypothetical protein
MKYAAEMGSGAMIYIWSFITFSSRIQKLTGGIHRLKDNIVASEAYFYFLKIRKVGESNTGITLVT